MTCSTCSPKEFFLRIYYSVSLFSRVKDLDVIVEFQYDEDQEGFRLQPESSAATRKLCCFSMCSVFLEALVLCPLLSEHIHSLDLLIMEAFRSSFKTLNSRWPPFPWYLVIIIIK